MKKLTESEMEEIIQCAVDEGCSQIAYEIKCIFVSFLKRLNDKLSEKAEE